jgi:hypothetical protein
MAAALKRQSRLASQAGHIFSRCGANGDQQFLGLFAEDQRQQFLELLLAKVGPAAALGCRPGVANGCRALPNTIFHPLANVRCHDDLSFVLRGRIFDTNRQGRRKWWAKQAVDTFPYDDEVRSTPGSLWRSNSHRVSESAHRVSSDA